ncbi:nectin-1-like isoform X2 [Chrysemys picta bellii]|uniref:nectin-1-like isoform X2 n=1 Tax=Chrysemys picta bellii TaxID=8478 RepID=UPI0032B188C5
MGRIPHRSGGPWTGILLAVVLTQRVKVRNEVTGYVGDEAMLQCLFPATSPDIQVSQVTWMKEMGGKKQNVAVYLPDHKPNFPLDNSGRIRFLNLSLQDATLIIQPLRMSDEGTYVCEFATYPHGNEDGVTTLSILARPTNTAESRKVVAGNTTIPVAVCTSANGKPPAQIKWLSTLPGNFNASEMTNGDGTVTVTSQFNMVPTAAADQQQITCVISQRTLAAPENIPVVLSVLYGPDSTRIDPPGPITLTLGSPLTLTCVADSVPAPSYRWILNGTDTKETGSSLTVNLMTLDHQGTYECQAHNPLTGRTAWVSVAVRVTGTDAPRPALSAGAVAGIVIGSLAGAALVGVGIYFFYSRCRNETPKENGAPVLMYENLPPTAWAGPVAQPGSPPDPSLIYQTLQPRQPHVYEELKK